MKDILQTNEKEKEVKEVICFVVVCLMTAPFSYTLFLLSDGAQGFVFLLGALFAAPTTVGLMTLVFILFAEFLVWGHSLAAKISDNLYKFYSNNFIKCDYDFTNKKIAGKK